jgi:hypothetical protein
MRSTDFPFAVMPQRLQRGGKLSVDYTAPSAALAAVRANDGQQFGGISARDTSLSDKIKDELAVRFGRGNAERLMSVGELLGADAPLMLDEARLAYREGRPGEAAATAALAVLPLPGAVKKGVKTAAKGAAKATKAAEKSLAVKPTQRAAAQPKPVPVKDIRPSTDDVYKVMEANTTAGRVIGDKMMPISKLTGGVTAAADDARRVDQLVEAMSSPEGYVSRLIVDDAGNVIEGQHRLEALRKMGVSKVPVTQYVDLERAVPFSAMRDAAAAQNIHPDQANQIAKQLAEIYADEGGNMAEVLQYSAPRGFEKAWEAAVGAMPKLLEKYMPASKLSLDPNFRRFFGKSKVVDEYGEPLPVYHGTADMFDAFSDAKIGKGDPGFLGRGFYFADNPYVAETYSKLRSGPQERVIKAYLALNNPFNWGPKGLGVRGLVSEGARLPEDIHDEIARRTGVSGRVPLEDRPYAERDVSLAVRELLEGRGYDSVIATDDFSDKPIEFVAFKPTQIKSAIGNRGTYDPDDPDIRKARGGFAVKPRRK